MRLERNGFTHASAAGAQQAVTWIAPGSDPAAGAVSRDDRATAGTERGPGDHFGVPGKSGRPMAAEARDKARAAACAVQEAVKPAGTLAPDAGLAAEIPNEGLAFVACGAETSALARGAGGRLADAKDGNGWPGSMR